MALVQLPTAVPGEPKPASLISRLIISIAIRTFCCMSTVCSLAWRDFLVIVRIENAAAITMTPTANPTISSISVKPASSWRQRCLDRRFIILLPSFRSDYAVEGDRSAAFHTRIALERPHPGERHGHRSLPERHWINHVGDRDGAPHVFELGAVHETVPEQTVSLRLRLRGGTDSATVACTLRINPVIDERIPPVELDALRHIRRDRGDASQLIRIDISHQCHALHR